MTRTPSTAAKMLDREPIAITGIGCRFPGGANTPATPIALRRHKRRASQNRSLALIAGWAGNDTLNGASGEHDNVQASVEDIYGGASNDTLTGSSAANNLFGLAGNDMLSTLDGTGQRHARPCLSTLSCGRHLVRFSSRGSSLMNEEKDIGMPSEAVGSTLLAIAHDWGSWARVDK